MLKFYMYLLLLLLFTDHYDEQKLVFKACERLNQNQIWCKVALLVYCAGNENIRTLTTKCTFKDR